MAEQTRQAGPVQFEVVLALGDDVSTDDIYPGRFMATVLPSETPQYCFADRADFNAKLKAGQVPRRSVVVAGANFGCGSSREQAASTLKGHDLIVVARSFARIFLQNSINLGLALVTAPQLQASEGDTLEIAADRVLNRTTGRSFTVEPLPRARQAIIDAGGLIPFTRQRVREKAGRK
jgi:3-isopropylmalate/(R)-2-methylmalate dehydratase small subunit